MLCDILILLSSAYLSLNTSFYIWKKWITASYNNNTSKLLID